MIFDVSDLVTLPKEELDKPEGILEELSAFYRVDFRFDENGRLLSIESEDVEPHPLVKGTRLPRDYPLIKQGKWKEEYLRGRVDFSLGRVEKAADIYYRIEWERAKTFDKKLRDSLDALTPKHKV